ncbi:MAG: outer membrane beta-barrel protein [Flavobacteriales bacterium]
MRVTITLIACFMTTLCWSQNDIPEITEPENIEGADTTRISLGNENEIIFINKGKENKNDTIIDRDEEEYDMDDFTFWSGIELGFTGLAVDNDVMDTNPWLDIDEARSSVVNLNIIERKLPIFKHHFGISTGLGFTWQDFAFNDTINLVNLPGDSIVGVGLPDNIGKYEKNKLKTGYIKLPVFVEINTGKNPDKNFHISAGLIGGWNFRSILKQRYKEDGDVIKSKIRGDYNLSPLSLEAAARIGYGSFTVFATSSLTSLFEEGKGPEAYPFTVGLSIAAF